MQLCEEKGCWLKDLDDVPSDELPFWVAYYDLEKEKRKKEEQRRK